jgi:hypothetical protein
VGRELFQRKWLFSLWLWIDRAPDFHTPPTTFEWMLQKVQTLTIEPVPFAGNEKGPEQIRPLV